MEYVESNGDPRYQAVNVETVRGLVQMRYYQAPGASQAILMVGGVGGGFDSPARDLYRKLGEELQQQGVSGLRVRFRHPTQLEEATYDVLAGLEFLRNAGVQRMALLGHSFGGAVVVSAAGSDDVVAVVTLAAQSHGAGGAGQFDKKSMLLIHGDADQVLHHDASRWIYQVASGAKDLRIYPGAGHVLDEVAADVHELVRMWLLAALGEP